jgi:hypothetical protein
MLWAFPEQTSGLHDEFLAGEFRVRLRGNSLELTFEGSGVCSPESARSLADSYVETLSRLMVGPLSLTTEADFLARTTPPFGGQMTGSSGWRQDRDRARRVVREARNEFLKAADPWLRRCYDHLQDAVENRMNPSPSGERTAYHDVYMAMEVLIDRFGSEDAAIAAEGSKNKLPSKRSLLGKSAAEFFQNVLGIDDASVKRTGQIDGKGYAGREKYEAMINAGRPVDLAWLTAFKLGLQYAFGVPGKMPMEAIKQGPPLVFMSMPEVGVHAPWCYAVDRSRHPKTDTYIVHEGPCVPNEPNAIQAPPAKALVENNPPGDVVIDTKPAAADKDDEGDGEQLEVVRLPEPPEPFNPGIRERDRGRSS